MTDDDWVLLNGYADGELSPEETAIVEARLAAEPDLAVELRRIRFLKSSLGALRPDGPLRSALSGQAEPVAQPAPPAGGSRRWRQAALAAAFLLVAASGLGLTLLTWPRDVPGDVAALHAELAGETYIVDLERHVTLSAGATIGDLRAPDLSATNLALVDVRTFEPSRRIAMHYRGRHGCRVTFVVDAIDGAAFGRLGDALLSHRWTTETRRFLLIADGMDENRFKAIGAFAEAASKRSEALQALETALTKRTKQARPCA